VDSRCTYLRPTRGHTTAENNTMTVMKHWLRLSLICPRQKNILIPRIGKGLNQWRFLSIAQPQDLYSYTNYQHGKPNRNSAWGVASLFTLLSLNGVVGYSHFRYIYQRNQSTQSIVSVPAKPPPQRSWREIMHHQQEQERHQRNKEPKPIISW
jgi:hypothetical protein